MSMSPADASRRPSATALLVQRHLSAPRLEAYLHTSGDDLDRALELYRWNAAVAGALWEPIGHCVVVLRNAEPLIGEDLTGRLTDMLNALDAVDPALRAWVQADSRLPVALAQRP